MKKILLLIYISFLPLLLMAQEQIVLTPYATASLLTCDRGEELYSQFGHTAIRIKDDSVRLYSPRLNREVQGIDWVYNYGIFDFDTDGFYVKFVKGWTYYILGVESMQSFQRGVEYENRVYYEQRLNLTMEQVQDLFSRLQDNARIENRTYLYNFVYDNCATRPHRMLQEVLQQDILPAEPLTESWRSVIDHYDYALSWGAFGINLVFGADADEVMTPLEEMFLPERLMIACQNTTLIDGTPLVAESNIKTFEIEPVGLFLTPLFWSIVVALLLLCCGVLAAVKNRIFLWVDALFYFVGGVLGLLLMYLMFFSIHPFVHDNYNFMLLNPLLFVPFCMILFRRSREWYVRSRSYIGIALLMLNCIRLVCPQKPHLILIITFMFSLYLIDWSIICRKIRARKLAVIGLLLVSATAMATPRLTVVVCVDGMTEQNMTALRQYWTAGGLRTLDEEASEVTVSFPHLVYGGSETLATICTGETPAIHGISRDTYFSRQDRKEHNVFADSNYSGIGTSMQLSPRQLLATTFTDEFRMWNTDKSKIYSIGITPSNTILLAGHAANACAWIDAEAGKWVTTSFYKEGLPAVADKQNTNGRITDIKSRQWYPRMDIAMYTNPTAEEKKKQFLYNNSEVLLHSPAANTLVVELALELQKEAQLGKDIYPDMLLLELTTISPKAQSDYIHSAEQEDMYLGINQDLGYLMEQLDRRIGKDNYQVILFGIPVFGRGNIEYEKAGMQVRYFNTDRASALINTYLMAMYGHERWIDGGYGNSIYLNHTLIEQKKLPILDLQRQVSNFLLEFEGTQAAYPISDVPLLTAGEQEKRLQQSVNKLQSGDVVFLLQPLWVAGESEDKTQDRVVETSPKVPLYIWTKERLGAPEKKLQATEIKQLILR